MGTEQSAKKGEKEEEINVLVEVTHHLGKIITVVIVLCLIFLIISIDFTEEKN